MSGEIESLGIGLTARTDLLGKDFDRAMALVDQFAQGMTEKLSRVQIAGPKIDSTGSPG
jgi:hypothetical protein